MTANASQTCSPLPFRIAWIASWLGLNLVLASCATAQPSPIKIIIAGDSTVANGKPGNYVGWGQFIGESFTAGVTFDNRAVSGTGTAWWLNAWPSVLKQKPDYVFIQLGHNDKAPQPQDTSPAAFVPNLRRLVTEAQVAGAKVVLITPVAIRAWTQEGKFLDPLRDKAAAVTRVAKELDVLLLDLHQRSVALCERLGPEDSRRLGHGPTDGVHFCPEGARLMAGLVAQEIARGSPALAFHLKPAAKSK